MTIFKTHVVKTTVKITVKTSNHCEDKHTNCRIWAAWFVDIIFPSCSLVTQRSSPLGDIVGKKQRSTKLGDNEKWQECDLRVATHITLSKENDFRKQIKKPKKSKKNRVQSPVQSAVQSPVQSPVHVFQLPQQISQSTLSQATGSQRGRVFFFGRASIGMQRDNHSKISVSAKFPARVSHPLVSYQPENS